MKDETSRGEGREAGFALILVILSLMLLTFLGLTLAATTSTELQIATNYRWSQQALYNAEAGLAAARAFLQTVPAADILPTARSWPQPAAGAAPAGFPILPAFPGSNRNDEWGNAPRNFEPSINPTAAVGPTANCDRFGAGVGYGVIFDDGSTFGLPLQNKTTVQFVAGGPTYPIRGAFTVWVRRPLLYNTIAGANPPVTADDPNQTLLIVTAEGVAPATGAAYGATTAGQANYYANRAVRVLEATVQVGPRAVTTCKVGSNEQASETGYHCLE